MVPLFFSIIIPCFQQQPFLAETLTSLKYQSQAGFEVIIQDGGSTDGSLELLQEFIQSCPYPVHLESQTDGGQAAAINLGLAKARGDILCYLNSDDILYPGTLEKVAAIFEKHPDVDLVYGCGDYLDENGRYLRPYPVQKWDLEALQEKCFICQPACFWRAGLTQKIGLFDKSLLGSFDYDYWLRVASVGRVYFLNEPLAGSRCHPGAKTFKYRKQLIEESCLVQARYNKGLISPRNAHELACVHAEQCLNWRLPRFLHRPVFYLRFFQRMLELAPKTRGFLRPGSWKHFLPSYANSQKIVSDPLFRVTGKMPS